jgi:arsenate reductase
VGGRPVNVLFLCTGNSARSIIAEALLNQRAEGRFVAYSAGSAPKGEVHPMALQLLADMHVSTAGLRSKSWDEFAASGAPVMDVIVTVCDRAAAEACPVWPGRPTTMHWSIADPAAMRGPPGEQREAFRAAYNELESRIEKLTSVPDPWQR